MNGQKKRFFVGLIGCIGILTLSACGSTNGNPAGTSANPQSNSSGTSGASLPAGSQLFVYIEPIDKGCFSDGNAAINSNDSVSLVLGDPRQNPLSEKPLATGSLYAREGGCGLGASFTLNSTPAKTSGTVIDTTTHTVIGNIELTPNGNTNIYFSTNPDGSN